MEALDRNLISLKSELFEKGKAKRGFDLIIKLIESKKNKKLAHLLRDHEVESVYGEELIQRFEVDTLIEFYNILLIAAISGYIPPKLNTELIENIINVLSHPSVLPYYKEYYPYRLVGYTLDYVKSSKTIIENTSNASLAAFTSFLSLNRILRNDKDIEIFRNMLDFVWYDEKVDLKRIIKILSSVTSLNKAIMAKGKSAESKAVWGFFKYTSFISQFRELLESIEENKLLQSAMWMYHGYYFDRMNDKMKGFFKVAFKNIESALSSPELYTNIANELYGVNVSLEIKKNELKDYAEQAVKKSKEDVFIILRENWKKPIETFFA